MSHLLLPMTPRFPQNVNLRLVLGATHYEFVNRTKCFRYQKVFERGLNYFLLLIVFSPPGHLPINLTPV